MSPPTLTLDGRDAAALAGAIVARGPGYLPGWRPGATGADVALVQIAARYLEAVLRRLDQAPGRNALALLDLLGVELVPARGARAPLVFTVADKAPDARLPAATRVAAPPPPGRTDQVIFETETAVGLAAAKLQQVVSLWPGRDQWIDHSAAFRAGQPLTLWDPEALEDTPHALYLAHDVLLALAGACTVDVRIELPTPSSQPLDLIWEYWDGSTWREFLDMRPECDLEAARKLDGTDQLRRSGQYRLQTDCAESSPVAVNGITACWVRARLDAPLPPDPARILPEIDLIQLSTEVNRPVNIAWTRGPVGGGGTAGSLSVQVTDEVGTPLRGVPVIVNGQPAVSTDVSGTASATATGSSADVGLSMNGVDLDATVNLLSSADTQAQFQLLATGLAPDQAFDDTASVDLTKPFAPLGPAPQPGDAFYFSSAEAFAKPGARLTVYVQTAPSPSDQLMPAATGPIVALARRRPAARTARAAAATAATDPGVAPMVHGVSWEYWDGRAWTSLRTYTSPAAAPAAAPDDLTGTGVVQLVVPDDLTSTQVNGKDGLWMRVRLTSGGYGFTQQVSLPSGGTFVYVVSQPPTLSKLLLGYAWQKGPLAPEHVLTYNDFQYQDCTDAAIWPGTTFQPFQPVADPTPALYLGYDRPLPVDFLGTYLEIAEAPGDTEGPALQWESWDGGWQPLTVQDETHALRLPGMVSLIGPDGSQPLARFGTPLHWVRARLREDGPPGAPTLDGLFPNAVWATQQQTVTDEPIGASDGQPSQILTFRQSPVLPGEQVAVRELLGPRADVEWRILARTVLGDPGVIQRLEALLAAEATTTDVQLGPLRLVRDRLKRVTEAWVQWEWRRDLRSSGPGDRHYAVDRARGLIYFGDGNEGMIPPLGAAISAVRYQTGGGEAGNVAAKAISQLVGPIGGVESAQNPVPAEGGADRESLETLTLRGPMRLRARGRAVTPQDYQALAREADPAVAVATAIPCRDPSGRRRAGWLTLVIIPRSVDPRPWPSFELREIVRTFVAARADAALQAEDRIYVTGPDYQPVDVAATLVPLEPSQAGAVDAAARQALADFLHPLHGGFDGRGFGAGASVWLSDLAEVLARVPGVDYVRELALLQAGALVGTSITIGAGRVAVAGDLTLRITEP